MYEKRLVYRSFKFFLLQAVAITFEDLVIYFAKPFLLRRGIEFKLGYSDLTLAEGIVRVVGYCWVILWFCSTVPIWMDEASAVGFSDIDRGPIAQFLANTWELLV